MTQLVLATANPDKVAEIAEILGGVVELLPRPPEAGEVQETGSTLLANARLKAAAVATVTGRPAIADDTGLEVDGLGGRPGVHAARYAGEGATYATNVAKLLGELKGAKGPARRARFRTVALVLWPDGRELSAEGVVEGAIAEAARGEGGFGYDPVFVPDEGDGRTFAELAAESPAAKHAFSHRGRAFGALAVRLAAPG
jgi:XTP/dITP diphosphohydrolase